VTALAASPRIYPLEVELLVDRVRAQAEELDQAVVVLAPAERARPVPGGEGGRLVEEESSVKRPGCRSGERCQPLNSSLQAIQRLPL